MRCSRVTMAGATLAAATGLGVGGAAVAAAKEDPSMTQGAAAGAAAAEVVPEAPGGASAGRGSARPCQGVPDGLGTVGRLTGGVWKTLRDNVFRHDSA